MSERGSPRASYTASFKLRIVAYAVEKVNRAAGKKFSIDESCVLNDKTFSLWTKIDKTNFKFYRFRFNIDNTCTRFAFGYKCIT